MCDWCHACECSSVLVVVMSETDVDSIAASLHSYGWDMPLVFHTSDGRKLDTDAGSYDDPFFGLEIEIERGRNATSLYDAIRLISDTYGPDLFGAKSDGSLNNGIEYVSAPMTLGFAQALDWSAFQQLRRDGWRAWSAETAGIHIHVSRVAFHRPLPFLSNSVYTVPVVSDTESHLYRFGQLILRNRSFFQRFAGRQSRWARFEGQRERFTIGALKPHQGYQLADRYVPVNLLNDATVEIRLFRSSLNPSRIIANLELVASCVRYTRNLSIAQVANGALQYRQYVDWCRANEALYPTLVRYFYDKADSLDLSLPGYHDSYMNVQSTE